MFLGSKSLDSIDLVHIARKKVGYNCVIEGDILRLAISMIFATTSGIIYPAVRDRKCMMQAVQILSLARVLVKNPVEILNGKGWRGGATARLKLMSP